MEGLGTCLGAAASAALCFSVPGEPGLQAGNCWCLIGRLLRNCYSRECSVCIRTFHLIRLSPAKHGRLGERRQHVLFSYESEEPAIRQSYLDLQLQTKERPMERILRSQILLQAVP